MRDSRSWHFVLLAAAVAAFGCTRDTTAPGSLAGPLASVRRGPAGGPSAQHPVGEDYGHDVDHDWSGRSGSARILATAIYHGTSVGLTVISFAAADTEFATPKGNIVKLLVAGFTPAGSLAWVRNFNDLEPPSNTRQEDVPALDIGGKVAVMALVRGINRHRTDVVIARTTVVGHPANLSVGPVQVQPRWFLNTALPVSAVVTETGGDVSVHASCNLYVDGTRVDQIANMFVAAGDHVTCNFSTAIATIGTHEVKVTVENMVPGDANPDDNVSLGRVDIYSATGVALPAFNFTANVGDLTILDYDSTTTRTADQNGNVLANTALVNADSGRSQVSTFTGVYYGQVQFPVARLVLGQVTGGTVLDADTLTNLPQNGLGTTPCTNGTTVGGVDYSLCSYPTGYTVLTYNRSVGTVNYRSQNYNLALGSAPCGAADGCWTTLSSSGGTGSIVPWSTSLAFNVAITAGDTVYAAAPVLALAPVDSVTSYGPTCTTTFVADSVKGFGGVYITTRDTVATCIQGHSSKAGVAAAASGVGVTQLKTTP